MANQYDMQPIEYDMHDLERHSTYDQFLSLRDTLVFSGKKYVGKWWYKLCVWDKEKTVEVLEDNIFKQSFENMTDWTRTDLSYWPFVKWDYATASNAPFTPISCVIQKDWWYRFEYKMEVLPTATQKKVYTYIDVYEPIPPAQEWDPVTYQLKSDKGRAVFDMQWEWTLSWTASVWWDTWSCSVSFKLWQILQKVTAMWRMEQNLKKWWILVLRAKDAERWSNLEPDWNDLTLQTSSNYWRIEYLHLPFKTN